MQYFLCCVCVCFKENCKDNQRWTFTKREPVFMKGKGNVTTYICTKTIDENSIQSPKDSDRIKRHSMEELSVPMERKNSILGMHFQQFLRSDETNAHPLTLKFKKHLANANQVIPDARSLIGSMSATMDTKMSENRKKLFETQNTAYVIFKSCLSFTF